MRFPVTFLALIALAGCAIGPTQKDPPATYDLGAPHSYAPNQPRIRASVLVHNITAPAWLDTTGIIYRLGYQDAARQQVYANSRWVAAPGTLLAQRLRSRIAAATDGGVVNAADSVRPDCSLRIELDDFSQVFDSAASSRVVILARASLINAGKRTLQAQKSFSVERAAASANAEGGVRALALASDELIEAVTAWIAANLAAQSK